MMKFDIAEGHVEKAKKRSHPGRGKAKAGGGGCRTCKIRRLKCDKTRPSCCRCVSTGRTCDGYGIWSSVTSTFQEHSVASKNCRMLPGHASSIFILADTIEERALFEWFTHRTAPKLPGAFDSPFWGTLVFQASSSEPAVLHAVLALSSIQKREILYGDCQLSKSGVPDCQEQFALRQYSKAIGHLQPHFSTRSSASIRIALVSCVVFICLEVFRGHHKTAHLHLQAGLRLVQELVAPPGRGVTGPIDPSMIINNASLAPDNDCLVTTFRRLNLQFQLFTQTSQHPYLMLTVAHPELPATLFLSMKQAREHLEILLDEIFYVCVKARDRGTCRQADRVKWLDRYEQIHMKLACWLKVYRASRTRLEVKRDVFAYNLLHIYYIMARIMAHSSVYPEDQLVFDCHTKDFASIIEHSVKLQNFVKGHFSNHVGAHQSGTETIADIGWIAPLYYTAIKCRVHQVRLEAIKMLDSTFHREGIWDAKLAACVARKVVEVEEGSLYSDDETGYNFLSCNSTGDREVLLVLANESRIQEVQVRLPDDPLGRLGLLCRSKRDDNDDTGGKHKVWEYDLRTQRWIESLGASFEFG